MLLAFALHYCSTSRLEVMFLYLVNFVEFVLFQVKSIRQMLTSRIWKEPNSLGKDVKIPRFSVMED